MFPLFDESKSVSVTQISSAGLYKKEGHPRYEGVEWNSYNIQYDHQL